MTTITLGQNVQNFKALTTNNQTFELESFRGKNVLLYFYPKDNTAGCTQEAQDFRDNFDQFTIANTVIFGVSRDSLKAHENFKAKQNLPFELISDTDETLCQLFDVLKMKNMYGKQVIGIERSTFLINTDGVLIHEWRKVKVAGHCTSVLKTILAV